MGILTRITQLQQEKSFINTLFLLTYPAMVSAQGSITSAKEIMQIYTLKAHHHKHEKCYKFKISRRAHRQHEKSSNRIHSRLAHHQHEKSFTSFLSGLIYQQHGKTCKGSTLKITNHQHNFNFQFFLTSPVEIPLQNRSRHERFERFFSKICAVWAFFFWKNRSNLA